MTSKTPPLSDKTNKILKSQGILLFVVASIREIDFGSGVNVCVVVAEELFVESSCTVVVCDSVAGAGVAEGVVAVVAGLTTDGAGAAAKGDAYIATTTVC